MQNELMFPTRNQYAWFMLKNKKKKDQQSMHKSTTNSLLYSSKKKKNFSAFLWNWFSQLPKTVVLF